jgi:hypothetical protein
MAAKIQLQHEYEAMKREYEGAKNRRFFDREAKLMNNMQEITLLKSQTSNLAPFSHREFRPARSLFSTFANCAVSNRWRAIDMATRLVSIVIERLPHCSAT